MPTFLLVILSAVLYWVAAILGLSTALSGTNAAPVWPAAGVAYAMLAISNRPAPVAIGVFAGAWAANLGAFVSGGALPLGPSVVAAGLGAVGNAVEPLILALLLRRRGASFLPDTLDAVVPFLGLSAFACLLSGVWGPLVHVGVGTMPASVLPVVIPTWALGDWAGLILVAPAILWSRADTTLPEAVGSPVERIVVPGFAGGLAVVAFGLAVAPAIYLLPVAILWAALRYGRREAAWTACWLAACAVLGSLAASWFTGQPARPGALLSLQCSAAVGALAGVVVGVASDAARLRERALGEALGEAEGFIASATARYADLRLLRGNGEHS